MYSICVWKTIDRLQVHVAEYRHLFKTCRQKLKVDSTNQGEDKEGRKGERRQGNGRDEEGRKAKGGV